MPARAVTFERLVEQNDERVTVGETASGPLRDYPEPRGSTNVVDVDINVDIGRMIGRVN